MRRTQVYLTDRQQAGLKQIAEQKGQKKSDWKINLRKVKGVWEDHTTLDDDLIQIRNEFYRSNPT